MLTETFFIDWERSRGHVIPADGESSDAPPTADYHRNRHPNPIVIWRTYLIANEWNELQHYRKTSIALQCFVMLILLKWFNMEALAIAQPGADLGLCLNTAVSSVLPKLDIDITRLVIHCI
jgi:hypothetical protein